MVHRQPWKYEEVYLISQFDELNRQQITSGGTAFANPRNTAAGSLRQKDPRSQALKEPRLWSYQHGQNMAQPYPLLRKPSHCSKASRGLPVNPEIQEFSDSLTFENIARSGWGNAKSLTMK